MPRRLALALFFVIAIGLVLPRAYTYPLEVGPHVGAIRDAARTIATSVVAPLLLASAPLASEPAHASIIAVGDQLSHQTRSADGPTTKSATENYLPRRLYPGTYKNYCGPTPETQVRGGCVAHGWYGDAPSDEVDAACRLHDVSYCKCETELLSRQRAARTRQMEANAAELDDEGREIPLLSSMVALRFVTKPTLERTVHADAQYFDCVNRADRQLIAAGIAIRGEQQRSGCSIDPNLSWFCDLNNRRGTLAAFEKVNLSIFLRDLDSDDEPPSLQRQKFIPPRWRTESGGSADGESLTQLERRREADLRKEMKRGRAVAEAASSVDVVTDEEKILRKLAAEKDSN